MRKSVSLEESAAIRAQALKENFVMWMDEFKYPRSKFGEGFASGSIKYYSKEIEVLHSDYPHVPAVKELFEMYEEFKRMGVGC
jgi:hypothetical protein